MRYVFFGTPRFAEIVLRRLMDAGMPPAAVVSNPDRPAGRKKIVTAPPVKQVAAAAGIPVIQPEALDGDAVQTLQSLHADLFVVAAYAKIIPRGVLAIPRLGAVGVHPSLLPKYRGASPIQSAILNGEQETGVTIYMMDQKMDHGPILMAERTALDSLRTDYRSLEETLAGIGAKLLLRVVPQLADGAVTTHVQDEAAATYTKKFRTEDGFIDTAKEAPEAVVRKINALTPEPGAWTLKDGKRVKLLKAEARDGVLHLTRIQEEGGVPRSMP